MSAPPRPPTRVPPPSPEPPPWRPVAWRTRGWLLVLAAVTAVVIGWLMLQPKLRLMAARADRGEAPVPIGLPTEAHRAAQARAASHPPASGVASGAPSPAATDSPAERPACGDRPTPGCVGGPMPVMVLPPAPSSR